MTHLATPRVRTVAALASVVVIALGATVARGHGTAAPRADAIASLDFLTGCWERRAGARLVEEHWLAPRAGGMIGVARTTRNDTLVEHEFMRVETRGDTLVFIAHPSGQAGGEFHATSVRDRAVTFANAAHDFPQRVMYRAVGADSLVARIEGTIDGRARAVDFPYARVACANGTR